MNILLSNDDGVFAPGLTNLYKKLSVYHRVTVVAPLEERSTTGHSLSLDAPLRVRKIEENIYGCSGYPADCVLMGLGHFCKNNKPDLVISGINRGANIGQDLYYSGTMAAAREASFHGVASIAVSLAADLKSEDYQWEQASDFILELIKENIHEAIPELSLLNINVPNCERKQIKGVKYTSIGFRDYSEEVEERFDTRNRKYYWVAGNFRGHYQMGNSDGEAIDNNYIAFTPHQLVSGMERDFSQLAEIQKRLKDFK